MIHSAKVASFGQRGKEFGLAIDSLRIDMVGVQRRKRNMVQDLFNIHLDRYKASGVELIMGTARFIAPRTVEVALNDGGTRLISGEHLFLNLGTRAAMPDVPGLAASQPLTLRIVRDNLNGGNRTTRDRVVPFCVFTDPELARIGLNESEAKAKGIDYRVVKIPMSSVLRMRTLSELRGL